MWPGSFLFSAEAGSLNGGPSSLSPAPVPGRFSSHLTTNFSRRRDPELELFVTGRALSDPRFGSGGSPTPQPVLPFVARCLVGDGYGYGSAGVAGVFLFDLLRWGSIGVHDRHSVGFAQSRIERKLNLVPNRYVAGRLAVPAQVAAFQIAKVAEVVDRMVAPLNLDRPFAGARQRRAVVEKRVEYHLIPTIALAPHAEIARE